MAKLKISTYFPHIFSKFSSNFLQLSKWQNWTGSITGQQTFARTLWRSEPLFARMNSCCAKNAWFSGCTASASTNPGSAVAMSLKHLIYDISCVCQDEFLSHMSSSALSLGYGHPKAQKTKCHNKTCAFEQHRSIPTQTTGETVQRSYLLVLHQGLKQLHSKRAANRNRKKLKAWNKKVPLQDPASLAAKSHRDCLHRCHAGFPPFLSASSKCHPAKRRVLTPPRARKTQYDFGGKFHPHLQRIGNTEKARLLLEVDINLEGIAKDCCWILLLDGLTAETIPQGSGGTPSMNITLLSSLQTALISMLFDHTHIHPQTMNSSHMLLTRKLCWLIVMTLSNEKKRRNREAKRTFFNSSMSVAAPMTLNAFPANLKPPALPCANSHANSTPVQVCATCMCLPKRKAKEHWHCQKILPRLLKTIWQRKDVWKTLFQNKSSGTINLVYLPLELLNKTKKVSIKTRCLSQIFPNTLSCNLWATSHEQ